MGGYYPVFVDLKDKLCVVIGGGSIAATKVEGLLAAGGRVRVIAPCVTPALHEAALAGRIELVPRGYLPGDLAGARLAIAATGKPELNRAIAAEAEAAGVLFNAVDQPADSSFIAPAVVRRGDLVLAVSTGGRSPALAKRIARELAERYPDETASHLAELERIRTQIRAAVPTQDGRAAIWQELVEHGLIELVSKGDRSGAEALVAEQLAKRHPTSGTARRTVVRTGTPVPRTRHTATTRVPVGAAAPVGG